MCGDFLHTDPNGYYCPICDSYFSTEIIDDYEDQDVFSE